MRALFATAVACFALAACDQAPPLPPGMASRITAPGGHYTVAIPAGWSNGVLPTDRPPAEDEMDLGPAPVTIGDSSQGAGAWIAIRSGPPGPFATFNCCAPSPNVTIDGVVVNGGIDDGHYIRAWFIHAVNGQQVQFRATCSYEVPQSTCLAIIDSWRWEPPSRWSPAVIVIAALLGSAVVASFATRVIVLRRRRGPSAKAAEYRLVTRTRLTISLAAVVLAAAVPVVGAARLVHEPRTTSPDGQFSVGIPPGWQDVTSTRLSGGRGAPTRWVLEGPGANGPITVDVSWVDSSSGISEGIIPEFVLAHYYPVRIAGEAMNANVTHEPGGCCPNDRLLSVSTITRTVDGAHRQYVAGCGEPNGTAQDDATCLAVLSTWRWEAPSSRLAAPILLAALTTTALAVAAIAVIARRRRRSSTRGWRRAP